MCESAKSTTIPVQRIASVANRAPTVRPGAASSNRVNVISGTERCNNNTRAKTLFGQPGKSVNTPTNNNKQNNGVVLTDFHLRVLVVEDNQDLARLFCDLLEVMGCETSVAFNAHSGIEAARQNPPDLVFCDLRLPGEKNGLDLAQTLRADNQLSHIPLIAVTGYVDDTEEKRALAAGFDRIFAKPIKFAQIQDVLKGYHAARQQ